MPSAALGEASSPAFIFFYGNYSLIRILLCCIIFHTMTIHIHIIGYIILTIYCILP
ncbi:hypothetical protein V1524DRAFT_423160 [Lipomyces starkeyi]